jgi:hypothetical protein
MADDVVHRVAIAGTDMYFDVVEGERILGAALAVSVSVIDPDNPYRYLEVRGVVADIVPDPEAKFYLHPNDRYDGPLTDTPADAAVPGDLRGAPDRDQLALAGAFDVFPGLTFLADHDRRPVSSPRRDGSRGRPPGSARGRDRSMVLLRP